MTVDAPQDTLPFPCPDLTPKGSDSVVNKLREKEERSVEEEASERCPVLRPSLTWHAQAGTGRGRGGSILNEVGSFITLDWTF